MAAADTITIGTRGSQLALWQANWIRSALERFEPALEVRTFKIKTRGDKILDVPLAKVGGKGLFVKEIEEAILDGRVDLAVHSMKDMPAEIPEGLCIGAVPKREAPQDVLIARHAARFADLPEGAVIGTSSLRRGAQLRHVRPDLSIRPLRGNLDTRLKKLESENLDAVVLAAAGVRRLGLERRITEVLDEEIMLPAVGQGALCVEVRSGDARILERVSRLDDPETRITVTGERAFLARLEGGCQVPIAAHGRIVDGRLLLTGLVSDVEGTRLIKETAEGPAESAEALGKELAETLLARGARKILDEVYNRSIG
ncbi:MAG: hydroxymethylbilane synthase [Desulfobacterales bacterium]